MTTKQLIADRLHHVEVLLKLMNKRIHLEEYEDYQHKAIIEGRKQTFESAYAQIMKVNHLEESDNKGSDKGRKQRFSDLISATNGFIAEVRKVIRSEINVEESEDDRVKSIVQGRDLALDLEELVMQLNKDMQAKVDKQETGKAAKDFATSRVKSRGV